MKTLGHIVLTAAAVSTFVACTPPALKPPEVVFKPCTEKPSPDQCEMFKDLFQVVDKSTMSLKSKRADRGRCCTTKQIDGELFEYCKNC